MRGESAEPYPWMGKNEPAGTQKRSEITTLRSREAEPTAVVTTATVPPVPTDTSTEAFLPVIPVDLVGSVSVGESLLIETFDQTGVWNTSHDAEYGAELVDGVYRMNLNTANWMVWSKSDKVTSDNIMMDLDTELISGSGENNQGIICR